MKQLNLENKEYIRLEYSFREWLGVLGYASTSVYGMPNTIREFLCWLEHKKIMDIESIDAELIDEYFEALRNRGNTRREGGLSNSYISKHLQAIKRFSTYLRQTEQGGFLVEVVTPKQVRNIKDILTLHEVQLLFDATQDDVFGLRDRVLLSIYYGCGLRRNEGIQLDVSDILFDRQMLYVRNGKNYTERYVPVRAKILRHLSEYINSGRTALLKSDKATEALFLSARGERINGQSLLHRLKGLKELTGNEKLIQKDIGLHSLRHSIATHLLMGGMKLERIGQFLGHKSIESTQIYAHIAEEMGENDS
jgi:integrase/recombinase XerD